ncbi:bifunctional diaminohydroxyphosphoribosylaminopyrimidine deaminase/5-amino-6-(5-phosphoribosylamino)uracil reductase RibD (plasmid) [Nitrobacteraceae bacterium UC4446_H13]
MRPTLPVYKPEIHSWPRQETERDCPGDKNALRFMNEALLLARQAQGKVWPNPAVGCVIVNKGVIVGRGQTQPGGRPHAERVALARAGTLAKGATLYVTLEPCCHWGETPPCTAAIIDAGIAAVYAALQDPDPRVNGGGFARLREANIDVNVGLGDAAAAGIMRGFFKRVLTGRPFVSLVADPQNPSGRIPSTCDGGAMTGRDGAIRLLLREAHGLREEIPSGIDQPAALLAYCGKIGLTSIFVMAGDPLAQRLQDAGLVDSVSS